MNTSNLFGVAAAFIALASFSVAIIYGDKTAKVIGAGANGFSNIIRSATLQSK